MIPVVAQTQNPLTFSTAQAVRASESDPKDLIYGVAEHRLAFICYMQGMEEAEVRQRIAAQRTLEFNPPKGRIKTSKTKRR